MAISGNQLKAARALAGWDQQKLATEADVGINTVRNMEASGAENVRSRTDTLNAVVRALESAGIEFTNGGQPGVKLKKVIVRCEKCGFEGTVEDQLTDASRTGVRCANSMSPAACRDFGNAISAAHQALRAVSPKRGAEFAAKARGGKPDAS